MNKNVLHLTLTGLKFTVIQTVATRQAKAMPLRFLQLFFQRKILCGTVKSPLQVLAKSRFSCSFTLFKIFAHPLRSALILMHGCCDKKTSEYSLARRLPPFWLVSKYRYNVAIQKASLAEVSLLSLYKVNAIDLAQLRYPLL
ncbi:hypothetical protein FJSC11DRAFT_3234 [Fischerella thermalis JSC-11]|uniref:Uncharacterized protein n=1 Tax=Fischerella thermalis JSC-11 TaxID=741277 RepID=G6FWI5_9CYAN|nr:hypothetical protein FJSC11DRAFT_3234 [Fischerella thermalis JSC-11]